MTHTHPPEGPNKSSGKKRRFLSAEKKFQIYLEAQDHDKPVGELLRREGLYSTQRVLTQTLRSLERDGYVIRTVHPTSPPTVEYQLTRMGGSLLKPMSGLVAWANQHFDQVVDSRKQYDVRLENLAK